MLFEGFTLGELADRFLFLDDRVGIAVVCLVVYIFTRGDAFCRRVFAFFDACFRGWAIVTELLDRFGRDFFVVRHYSSHFRASQIPKLLSHGLPVCSLAKESKHGRAFLRQDSEVAGRISHNLHWFCLFRECGTSVQEGWLNIVHKQHHPILLNLDSVSELGAEQLRILVPDFYSASEHHSIQFPLVMIC